MSARRSPPAAADGLDWPLLVALTDARGVSGDEDRVRALLADAVAPHVDALWTDPTGNLYALRRGARAGSADEPPVMVCAHMDEVGLIVTAADGDGLLRLAAVGGVVPASVVGQRVRIGAGGVPGVVGLPPHAATTDADRARLPGLAELRIDIGAATREAALALVAVGDVAVWDTATLDLGHRLLGKAFDDRAGCWALAMLLRARHAPDVVGVFSVQEETGLRGAGVAAHRLAPAVAFVLECGTTDDTPRQRDDAPVMRVGDGPAITLVDSGLVADRRLVEQLRAAAARAGIRHQLRAPKGGGTDGGRIHRMRAGIPTAVVSAPCRYLHGPQALVAKDDLAGMVALLGATLADFTPPRPA
mgnify:CR=1 FL=1